MTKKNALTCIAALLIAFLLGCCAALFLRFMDERDAALVPIERGQLFDLSRHGLTLLVPEDALLLDYTDRNLEYGGNARFAGVAGEGEDELRVFIYDNEQRDDIAAYPAQDLVRYYTRAGATQVRMREIAGRPFVCYRAQVAGEDGVVHEWDAYETWDQARHIVFETRLPVSRALSILASIVFFD